MMAAKQGLMGVSMTNAEALVVPTYAREPMFGTNPIAVTIPADPHPFHMDFATSRHDLRQDGGLCQDRP